MSPAPFTITDAPGTVWDAEELKALKVVDEQSLQPFTFQPTKYNPTPGTGRTGVTPVAPNSYPFYSEDERYIPVIQADGGQLSEWSQVYAPSKEQAEVDRAKAFASNIPHGCIVPGDKAQKQDLLTLTVVSELHDDTEYGAQVDVKTGLHSGGPFTISVSPKIRVEELRCIIRDMGGIIPGLQKLSYAGKRMEDSQRTLEHYGVAYWSKRFPHWPLKICRF